MPAKMPKSIRFGARTIALRFGDNDFGNDKFGCFFSDPPTIVLNRQMSVGSRADTVMHELIHAVLALRNPNLVNQKTEEALAATFGEALSEILLRNPELVRWIMEGCK